jgi:hypothetical protein
VAGARHFLRRLGRVNGQCHANVEKMLLEYPAKYRSLIGFGLFEDVNQWVMHSVAEDLEHGVLFERDSILPSTRLYFLMPAPSENGHLAILPRPQNCVLHLGRVAHRKELDPICKQFLVQLRLQERNQASFRFPM